MFGHTHEAIALERDVTAVIIPAGEELLLREGTPGFITQSLGGSFTIYIEGNLFRIAGADADAIGKEPVPPPEVPENATDADNNARLLEKLKDVPDAQRTARFQCLLVYLRHADDPVPLICQGSWEGRILHAAEGENGFGYDPLFFVEQQGCSSAQLPPELKNQISHRGQALRELVAKLQG